MPRVFHSDSRSWSTFNPSELVKLCGVSQSRWPEYVLKELLDNAAAALEEFGCANPCIWVEIGKDSISVADSGPGISDETLAHILDFDRFGGSSRHHRLPTRGAQGNALMTVVGITSAWDTHVELRRPDAAEIHIAVDLDPVRQTVAVEPEVVGPSGRSRVLVRSPVLPWKRGGSEYADLVKIAKLFAWVNPHISFMVKESWSDTSVWSVPREDGARPALPGDHPCGSVSWFGTDDMAERLAADVRSRPGTSLQDWLREFMNAKRFKLAEGDRSIGSAAPSDKAELTSLAKRLKSKLESDGMFIEDPKFVPLGEDRLAEMLVQVMGADGSMASEYKSEKGVFAMGDAKIPFLVEVCLRQLSDGARQAPPPVLALNRTILYGSPSFSNLSWREKVRGEWHGLAGDLGALLRAYQIDSGKTPAAVVVHVTCPAPGYSGYGKQSFDTTWLGKPLSDCMERVTLQVRRQRAGEARRSRSGSESTESIRDTLFGLIPAAWERDTENGRLPIMLRQLFYSIRKSWALHHHRDLQYATYCAYIDEYEQRIAGKSICLRDPRGTLIEPHSGKELRLGTDAVNRYEPKKWEGHTLIVVEKEQFAYVLKAYGVTRRYDAIIIGSKGFAVESCREVLQKYKKLLGSMVNIIALHDADPAGYMIGWDLACNLPRFGDNVEVNVIDVGLTMTQGTEMGLQDEPFELKRSVWSMVKNMRSKSIQDPGGERRPLLDEQAWDAFMPRRYRDSFYPDVNDMAGRRIELNAMAPRQFIAWLESHLDKHNCRKVHPPKEIVDEHLRNARENMVRGEVGRHLMRVLGDDVVHRILSEIGVPAFDLESVLKMKPEQSWAYLTERAGQTGIDIGPIIERALAGRVQ